MSDNIKDIKKQISELADEVSEIGHGISATNLLLSEHFKQDERFYEDIKDLKDGQQQTNKHLGEYNIQLQVHIAGVLELRRSNELLQKKIEQEGAEITKRLEVAELPIKWAQQTATVVKWVTVMTAGLSATMFLVKVISGAASWGDFFKAMGLL